MQEIFPLLNVYTNLWVDNVTTNNGMQQSTSKHIYMCAIRITFVFSTLISDMGFASFINLFLRIRLQASTKVERPTTRKQTRGAAPLR